MKHTVRGRRGAHVTPSAHSYITSLESHQHSGNVLLPDSPHSQTPCIALKFQTTDNMASLFSRSFPSRTLLASTSIVGAAGVTYYTTRRPLLLDSPQNAPTKTFSFPGSMLFSKQLTVTSVEQVNHDTKRITLSLPGGSSEVSGVPASCMSYVLLLRVQMLGD